MLKKFEGEKWKTHYLGLVVILLVSVSVYNKWFFTNGIFGWGDWGFNFAETAREWLTWPSVWVSSGLGSVDISLFMYLPVRVFEGLLSRYFDFNYFNKIVFLWPSVIIPAVGTFLLVKNVTKSTIAAIVGSFVYLFNTYILGANTGHFTLSVAYGIGIFVFLLYQKALQSKKYKWVLLSSLTAFIQSSYEPRAFYLTAWVLSLYLIYFSWKENKLDLKLIAKNISLTVFFAITTILLNSFWLFGLLTNSSSFSGIVEGRQLYGEGHFIIQMAFTMFHPFWTGSHRLVWSVPGQIFWWFWLIPFLAFGGFWFNRKNTLILFWTVIALLGIFLTKFTSQPFTGVYLWLYQHLPGFSVFRESSKFNYFVDLGYAVLIASFVTTTLKANISKWFKWLLTIGVSSLFLMNAIPVFTGDLGRLLTPRNIPNDYLVLKSFIQHQPEFFRTLYVPTSSRWGYWDSTHPNMSMIDFVRSDWKDINDYKLTGLEFSDVDEVTNVLKKDFANKLLDSSSIKYIIVPKEDLENEDIFIYSANLPRLKIIKFLDKLSYLKKMDIGTRELVVYENDLIKPRLYLDNNASVVVFRRSPGQYDLTFTNTNLPNKLFFSESFNPGWKIRVGDFSWWKSLVNRNYFLPDENHIQTEFELNEFLISGVPADAKITVYFAPQAWVNLGAIISASTLGISLIALTFLWWRGSL